MSYLSTKLTSIDQFGFAYEFALNKKEGKYKTSLGGVLTLVINTLILYLTYNQLYIMWTYGNDTIQSNVTQSDFKEIGNVTIEMLDGRLPFYNFMYKMKILKKNDEMCGGDCYEWLQSYFDFYWVQMEIDDYQ